MSYKRRKTVFLSVFLGALLSTVVILILQAQAIADPSVAFLVINWLGAPIWVFAWIMATVVFTMLMLLILTQLGVVKK